MGEKWRLRSYDALFRFATRRVTNQVAIVFMDNKSFEQTGQSRSNGWARARHAKFLNRLAADRCPLAVFDVFFNKTGDPTSTAALAEAMARFSNVVVTTKQEDMLFQPDPSQPGLYGTRPVPPFEIFFQAVRRTNWGVGNLHADDDGVVRQHWRFPSPGIYDSVAWTTAKLAGARLGEKPEERWIRYYAPGFAWKSLSYVDAEVTEKDYFRDKIVFIGNKPIDSSTRPEPDKFATPFTGKEGPMVGGVEILATEFLNLVNHEWLRRPPPWIEVIVFTLLGAALSFGLCSCRLMVAPGVAVAAAFLIFVGAIYLSYFTNYWFPWTIIVGAQVPLALVVAAWPERALAVALARNAYRRFVGERGTTASAGANGDTLTIPDYELIQPPFAKGAYGQVWLARNAVGQWQAIKAIYRKSFGEDAAPYEREFRGIEYYKPISDKHPGLLRIDFVSQMKAEGYFYYAMELGDAVRGDWECDPSTYQPLDLAALCVSRSGRLPVIECVRVGIKLCEALQFLHAQGLAHRDIKPRNIIFVKGRPKLADVGLVADAHRPAHELTLVGTPGFMPPYPEPPGTHVADIYALGMVLYVISTGRKPAAFPELSETIVDAEQHPDFTALSTVIFRACQPDGALRYASAAEMQAALAELEIALDRRTELARR
jgi:CHASE2 domain-containing sensor protein